MRTTTLLILIQFIISGCVSVKLSEELKPAEKSKIQYSAPKNPFERTQLDQADSAWLSSKTGNSISFISDCKGSSLPLRSIRSNLFSDLQELKIADERNVDFNGREALRSVVTGRAEGIPVKINVLVFVKNLCTYSLTYVALSEKYSSEIGQFDQFVGSFKVND